MDYLRLETVELRRLIIDPGTITVHDLGVGHHAPVQAITTRTKPYFVTTIDKDIFHGRSTHLPLPQAVRTHRGGDISPGTPR